MNSTHAEQRTQFALESERLRFRHLFERSPVATWSEDWTALPSWMDELRAAGVEDLEAHFLRNPAELRKALQLVRVLDVNEAAVLQNVAENKQHLIDNLPALFTDAAYAEFGRQLVALWRGEERYRYEYEARAKRLDGKSLDLIVRVDIPVIGDAPDLSGVILTATDITARKHAEERLRACIENTPNVAVQWYDERGRVVYWNPASETVFGWKPTEAVGRTLDELIQTPAECAEFVRMLADIKGTGKTLGPAEYTFRRRDGTKGVCLSTIFELPGDAGEARFACMDVDLTERRNLEMQLLQSQKMEAIGRFAGGVAHDFNNLLTVISGHADLLTMNNVISDSHADDIEEIRKATERAAALTRQLIAFSRQQVIAPRLLNLNGVVVNTERMLRRLIGEDVHLTISSAPSLKSIRADPGQLEQVLMNLAVNARDAMPGGGEMRIETQDVALGNEHLAAHPASRAGSYVQLTVSDSGSGMSEEVKMRIFEPFFTTKGNGKGTGLGLAVVHSIVQQSGGHIDVRSAPGSGTTFCINLPAVDEVPAEDAPAAPADIVPGSETILLVEDDDVVRKLTMRSLDKLGYDVLVAANGADALRLAKSHKDDIQLLIADVVLPDACGREIADKVQSQLPSVRTLFISGYTDETVIRHGVHRTTDHFLQKPYTVRQLAAKVRDALDEQPAL